MTTIKAILVDDQKIFADGLKAIFKESSGPDVKVMKTFYNGERLETEHLNVYDLVILDLNLPDIDGLDLIPKLRKRNTKIKILVLTSYGESRFVKEAFQKGADGYILKSNDTDELMEGIETIMQGNTFIASGLRITPSSNGSGKKLGDEKKLTKVKYEDRYIIKQKLTKREHEILSLISQAKNNKEIARELYISDQTVGVHRKNIMRKLGVHNTVNLIKFALEHHLI